MVWNNAPIQNDAEYVKVVENQSKDISLHSTLWIVGYNQTPITPLGTKSFVHERIGQRRSHADHGKVGYVIGPSPQHYWHIYFYIPAITRNHHTDTYIFIPSKFELPENVTVDRATKALEEFTAAMKSKQNQDIQFTNKSINNAIGVLFNLLKPTTQAAPSTATRPRVAEAGVQRPRVDVNNNNNRCRRVNNNNNNNNNDDNRPPRVLQPRPKVHQQTYSQGMRVYRIFGDVNRLLEHQGYICDFDKKEGYYKVKYQYGDTEE